MVNKTTTTESPIIIALDFESIEQAKTLVTQLSPIDCRLKVGKEMFTLFGPDWVHYLCDQGFDVFLDLKFHDIPNTVAKAVSAAAKLGVWMVNVHASGGPDMISAAKDALGAACDPNKTPLLTAVTILTSMDERQFSQVYQMQSENSIQEKVSQLAQLAQTAGADGVVCSAKEARVLRRHLAPNFKLVCPGIRPNNVKHDDQKRVVTPIQAINEGVDYLVIGRPITQSNHPQQVVTQINQSLLNAKAY